MIALYLVTGFLGAGKTTALRHLVRLLGPGELRLIINEFGQVGVDGTLLAQTGAVRYEVNGGSVFCSCRLDQFEDVLDAVVREHPDTVVIEASGLSDPSAVRRILAADKYARIDYRGAICVVDAARFPKVFATARVCRKQLSASGLVIVNKADLVCADELAAVTGLIRENFPDAEVRVTRFGAIAPEWLAAVGRVRGPDAGVEDRDITAQKYVIDIRESVRRDELMHFIRMFAEDTYRVKGFVRLADEGLCFADCVGTDITVTRWEGAVPGAVGRLVVLAGKAMNPRRSVRAAMALYPDAVAGFGVG
ncbi:MAG: GTP-binding protein [Micrococcales bacterium]|nr:GTP-binding protein [Micrococcales bacterium]